MENISTIERLIEEAGHYLPPDKIALVQEAYNFSAKAHEGQKRLSGDSYIEHPLQVAMTLVELQLDADSLAAALLHDVIEDCGIPMIDIETRFGSEVAKLVDGVTRLGNISWAGEEIARRESQAKNLRKMLVAMAEDIRVIFIKLADRLHNMLTLQYLPPQKRVSIAQETLEIYTPLAHRLGIWEVKWQLEDQALRYLQPEVYKDIAKMIADRRVHRENFITQAIQLLKEEFEKAGLKAEISGRPKHIFSIYQKMQKYETIGKHFDDIHDLLALRVMVSSVSDCYNALGIVHTLWHPLPDEFDDYIANPKPNGYQSLHTTVMYLGTTPLELQIRSYEMHRVDEYGIAAHWRYKEGGQKGDVRFEERITWLRQLIDWHREFSGAEEFMESVKTDIFNDQVFVYTPKGEIKDLPSGSTPLDFAYRVHTELGHHCVGAKVNGKLVALNQKLKNGDIVEIMSVKGGKGPSQDWLRPNLGYANTSSAREKIRQWFKKQKRQENIERGRELLDKELKRLGIKVPEKEEMARLFKFEDQDDFLAAIGYGGISAHTVVMKLVVQTEPAKIVTPAIPKSTSTEIKVLGVGDMLTRLGECCHPMSGDAIIGYITRSRGVTVHKQNCPNVVHEKEKERLIDVDWGQAEDVYPAKVQVEAWDRVGLVRDITSVVAEEKVNISSVSFTNRDDHTTSTLLALDIKGLAQLSRIMEKIEGVRGVISVNRVAEETVLKSGTSSAQTGI